MKLLQEFVNRSVLINQKQIMDLWMDPGYSILIRCVHGVDDLQIQSITVEIVYLVISLKENGSI